MFASPIVGALAIAATLTSGSEPSSLVMFPTVLGSSSASHLSLLVSDLEDIVAWRPTLKLLSSDDLSASTVDDRPASFFECGADPKCWSQRLAPFGVDLCLLVVINGTVEPPILSVRAIRISSGEVADQVTSPIEGELKSVVRQRIDQVLKGAGHHAVGRISIGQGTDAAEVRIEPDPLKRRAPLVYDVRPGRYRVTAASQDGRRLDVEVDAQAEEDLRIDFPPLPVPEEPSVLASPWLWIAVGIGAAAATIGIFVATRPAEDRCVCIGTCPEC